MQTTDQLGNILEINFPPQRIVSLVPSQTELLFDLGLEKQVVGVTRFCIHPKEKIKGAEKIGGTKQFNFENIKALQPDLVIGNKEENYEEGIVALQKYFPVWMSDINTLNDAYAMMSEIGRITDRANQAERIVAGIKSGFDLLPAYKSSTATAAYFIWRKPYMVAAANTFIDEMLKIFGAKNVFENQIRYPEINPEELAALKPDFIFLSSEPYSFSEKHFGEFQSFCPSSKIIVVDGEMFSWYGSRLKYAAKYFEALRRQIY